LLSAEGRNLAEIAGQMGHTLQTLLSKYAHVIDELRGGKSESTPRKRFARHELRRLLLPRCCLRIKAPPLLVANGPKKFGFSRDLLKAL